MCGLLVGKKSSKSMGEVESGSKDSKGCTASSIITSVVDSYAQQ
jgi:hypothetical protein